MYDIYHRSVYVALILFVYVPPFFYYIYIFSLIVSFRSIFFFRIVPTRPDCQLRILAMTFSFFFQSTRLLQVDCHLVALQYYCRRHCFNLSVILSSFVFSGFFFSNRHTIPHENTPLHATPRRLVQHHSNDFCTLDMIDMTGCHYSYNYSTRVICPTASRRPPPLPPSALFPAAFTGFCLHHDNQSTQSSGTEWPCHSRQKHIYIYTYIYVDVDVDIYTYIHVDIDIDIFFRFSLLSVFFTS